MTTSWTSRPATAEPFGQTGVRQFFFPALTVLSLTCMVLSLGMWLRSHFIVDHFRTERAGTTWYISSIYGRVLITWGSDTPFRAPRNEWRYVQEPLPEDMASLDKWKPSIWKSIGIEWRGEPLDSDWGTRGGWLRIRWRFMAAIWAILPLARVIREQRRRVASA